MSTLLEHLKNNDISQKDQQRIDNPTSVGSYLTIFLFMLQLHCSITETAIHILTTYVLICNNYNNKKRDLYVRKKTNKPNLIKVITDHLILVFNEYFLMNSSSRLKKWM